MPFDAAPANCTLVSGPALRRIHHLLGDLLRSDAATTCPLGQLTALQAAHKHLHDAIYFDADATQPITAVDDLPLAAQPTQWMEGMRVELVTEPDALEGDPFPLLAGALGTVARHPLSEKLGVAFDGRGGCVTTGFLAGGIFTQALNAVQVAVEGIRS
jgi:hypothetical protein